MVLFIEAKYKYSKDQFDSILNIVKKILSDISLEKTVYFSSSIQYLDLIKELYSTLKEEYSNISLIPRHDHSCYPGQILGCSYYLAEKKNVIFFNFADGYFHSKILKINNPDSTVFKIDPLNLAYEEINKDHIQKIFNNKKKTLTKFFYSKKIGIIISLKPGQMIKSDDLIKFKQFLDSYDKEYYIFLSDNINLNEFDNFNFIDYWVNTACPRLSYDDSLENERDYPYYRDLYVLEDYKNEK